MLEDSESEESEEFSVGVPSLRTLSEMRTRCLHSASHVLASRGNSRGNGIGHGFEPTFISSPLAVYHLAEAALASTLGSGTRSELLMESPPTHSTLPSAPLHAAAMLATSLHCGVVHKHA